LAPLTTDGRAERVEVPSFAEVYSAHVDFVWRSARRLGISEAHVEDVVQDVFVTVHRRLPDFEGRSAIKTWLFGIALRVVRDYRRRDRRKPSDPLPERELADVGGRTPEHHAVKAQRVRVLHILLGRLTEEQREVFVLSELEQMTAPEIAAALGLNVNTVYSRVRAARQAFERALQRHRAQQGAEA
jgi:RNA polymerase sigma-70 factor (ECF subfamily)